MTQRELNRAVARATGESVETIQRVGFLLADPADASADPDDDQFGPYLIDWDRLDSVSRELVH